MAHLTTQEIEALLTGRLSKPKRLDAIRHLVAGCGPCGRLLLQAVPAKEVEDEVPPGPWAEAAYEICLDRAFAAVPQIEKQWHKEHEKLAQVLELLGPNPLMLDGLTLQQVRTYRGWPLVEALLRRGGEARFRDPLAMRALCILAKEHAETLAPGLYGRPALVFDLRARAWAELANAHRVNEEYERADDALARAVSYRQQGTGDLLLLARISDLEASLRRAQRRFAEAIALLDNACKIYLSVGDAHLAGWALINKGNCARTAGEPRDAIQWIREGQAQLDGSRDPRLAAFGKQALLDAMVDCGQFQQASRMLMSSGLRQAFASDPLNLLRLRWVEGKILAGRDRLARAERALAEVRQGFEARGLDYDAALVGLELAAVWLRQGKTAEVRELAQDMLDTFEELDIEREAFRALWFFNEVCRHKVATVRMAHGIRSFLGRLHAEPQLLFDPESIG
jgi:tetratricopeptide (TPR) repeat protein